MKNKTNGSALIVVLLLLVMMMLMGFALMRSTELATLISGNVATKQAATQAGEVGLQAAESKLKSINSSGTLDTTNTDDSYSKETLSVDPEGLPIATETCPWSTITDLDNGLSYQYIIERLCNSAGDACMTKSDTDGDHVLYRITVKITGARNTESYIQALYGI